jgi:trigger factor
MPDEPRSETSEPEGGGTATAPEAPQAAAGARPEGPAAPPAEGKKDAEEPLKLTQTVELKDIGPCKKHIKVEVDRGAIDKLLDEKYSELVTDANVAGFRPGKAPRRIIERRFHKDVTDQVKAQVLLQSLEQLADEHDVAPLSSPELDPAKIDIPKEGPFVYEFDVEVRPEFDLPDYKGLKLRRPVRTFSEEDVAEEECKILAPHGKLVPKPQGDAQLSDHLIADLTTRDGGRVLSALKAVNVRVEARLVFKDGVAERFLEQVKGVSAGQSRTVDVTISENVADASLRGKTVQAQFDVKEVKSLVLPELTREFLHEFGVHTPEQLRERVRVLLQRRLEYLQRQSAREQVLAHIDEAARWELPQDLLARQARKALARRVMEMRSGGMSEEEIKARERLLKQDVLRTTALALKELFVLQKIAEIEKLDATDDDVQDEIERIAAQTDETPRRVRARLEKEEMLDALAGEIIERKALDLVLENAEYEDMPIGPQDDRGVATVEEQAVPGEIQDRTAVPAKAEEAAPQAKDEDAAKTT